MWIFLYILEENFDFILKSSHMKKATTHHTGDMATTIGLAIAFLGLVMFLSYLFINATMK